MKKGVFKFNQLKKYKVTREQERTEQRSPTEIKSSYPFAQSNIKSVCFFKCTVYSFFLLLKRRRKGLRGNVTNGPFRLSRLELLSVSVFD